MIEPNDGLPTGNSDSPRVRRTQPRETRRLQLIESTIDCIAERGLVETRMADVAAGAGMSVGIVNFHFDGKQTLLAETLRFLSDEYRDAWNTARHAAPPDPVAQIEALIRMNFEPRICNPRRIAVWFAFFGEARSRPTYRSLCQQFDNDYLAQLSQLFEALPGEHDSAAVHGAAKMLLVVWDGMWQNILLNPEVFTAESARECCLDWLHRMLPASEQGSGHE